VIPDSINGFPSSKNMQWSYSSNNQECGKYSKIKNLFQLSCLAKINMMHLISFLPDVGLTAGRIVCHCIQNREAVKERN